MINLIDMLLAELHDYMNLRERNLDEDHVLNEAFLALHNLKGLLDNDKKRIQ